MPGGYGETETLNLPVAPVAPSTGPRYGFSLAKQVSEKDLEDSHVDLSLLHRLLLREQADRVRIYQDVQFLLL